MYSVKTKLNSALGVSKEELRQAMLESLLQQERIKLQKLLRQVIETQKVIDSLTSLQATTNKES